MKVHMMCGDLSAAEAVFREAQISPYRSVSRVFNLTVEMAGLALILRRGGAENALTMSQNLVTDIKAYGAREIISEALYLQAKAYIAAGQKMAAVHVLGEAREAVEKQGGQRLLWQILAALSELESDPTEAAALKTQAQQIIFQIANNIRSGELRKSFLDRVEIRELVDS